MLFDVKNFNPNVFGKYVSTIPNTNLNELYKSKAIKRDSKEFDDFIDEMYVSILQNPLYRNCLKKAGDKYILHALGGKTKLDTVFTRYEFEYELNALKAYVQQNY